jgi:hypothetical protein
MEATYDLHLWRHVVLISQQQHDDLRRAALGDAAAREPVAGD